MVTPIACLQGEYEFIVLQFVVYVLILSRPGINDDGSGTVGVLVVAEALSKYKVKNAVRLGFWGAEEVRIRFPLFSDII